LRSPPVNRAFLLVAAALSESLERLKEVHYEAVRHEERPEASETVL